MRCGIKYKFLCFEELRTPPKHNAVCAGELILMDQLRRVCTEIEREKG